MVSFRLSLPASKEKKKKKRRKQKCGKQRKSWRKLFYVNGGNFGGLRLHFAHAGFFSQIVLRAELRPRLPNAGRQLDKFTIEN
jgi:hypothetical protein